MDAAQALWTAASHRRFLRLLTARPLPVIPATLLPHGEGWA